MPYQSNNRIADLMLARGNAASRAVQGSGEAWAHGIRDIGQIAAGTIGDLLQNKRQQDQDKLDAPRREAEQIRLDQLKKEQAQTAAEEGIRQLVPRNPDGSINEAQIADEMTSQGFGTRGQAIRTDWQREQDRQLDRTDAKIARQANDFGKADAIMTAIKKDPSRYAEYRAQLVALAANVDPSLVAGIPETYDAKALEQMHEFTNATRATLATDAKVLQRQKDANAVTDDNLKRSMLHQQAAAVKLSRATSADEWERIKGGLRQIGIPERELAEFGDWDEDAASSAALRGMTPAEIEAKRARGEIDPKNSAAHNLYLLKKKEATAGGRVLTAGEEHKLLSESIREAATLARKPGGEGSGDDAKDPYFTQDRARYNDYVEQWKRENPPETAGRPGGPVVKDPKTGMPVPAAVAKPKAPVDFDTWRFRNVGRGAPSRDSQEVHDRVQKILEEADPQRVGVAHPDHVEKNIKTWLDKKSNRQGINIQ